MSFTGQTLAVLRSILLASAVLALALPSRAGGPLYAGTEPEDYGIEDWSGRLDRSSLQVVPLPTCCRRPISSAVRIVHLGKGACRLVNVCIEGVGPFPFLIDSGSALSVVDTQLSRRFHLHQVGAPEQAAGIGLQRDGRSRAGIELVSGQPHAEVAGCPQRLRCPISTRASP